MAKKILIVDDENDIVEVLTVRLKANGYEVIAAFDGQEGLDTAKSQQPDLILLDLMLPKLNGYDVCRDLKNNPAYKHIPIIMLTAKSMASDEILGLETGAEEYVNKPYVASELLQKIKGYIG